MKNRKIISYIQQKTHSKFGRILILTGARQTGKTTLVKEAFPEYEYISIEDPVTSKSYLNLTAHQWAKLHPNALLDEIQKEPRIIESIKAAYDQFDEPHYVLLGSSQLLLMEKVRESLAGRCSIVEMYPLTLPELQTKNWNDTVSDSLFQQLLKNEASDDYLPSFLLDKCRSEKLKAFSHYLKYGGFPAISEDDSNEEDKFNWLHNYVRTYLERDIRDLASFRDLGPFIKLQQYIALNTGNLINASSIAKQLGVNIKTVQRYIKYFEISYQAIVLPAWSKNQNKRLVKTSKVHYIDQGIIQAVLRKRGGMTGKEFESAMIAEMFKQAKNELSLVQFSFLRTHDGKEIDLLLEFPNYYYAFEIKMANKVNKVDAKHLFGLEEIVDKPIKKAFLLSNDEETKYFDNKTIAVHAAMFLG
ncbi:MAG: ATP-binding protein [Prevotellaceae bacterium]|jgi:predicted AAA+ superfamily ATPase|nr:ATP-binding protein [Prevotellaceae bacterium]